MLVRPPECPNGFIYVHSMFLLIIPSRTFAASARRDKYVGIREHLQFGIFTQKGDRNDAGSGYGAKGRDREVAP